MPAASFQGLGGFIDVTAQSDERPFNLGRTLLDARTVELWRKLSARTLWSFGRYHLGYGDPHGMLELRKCVCDYLQAARGVRCEPEQVVITAGTQQAIDIICQAVAASFMEEGHFASHIRRMRELYRKQRDALVAARRRRLGEHLTVDPPDQGMHLVAYMRRGKSDAAIERAGREHGVIVRAMSRLYVEAPAQPALLLGFSGYPHQIIAPAVARLARAFER